MGDSGVYGTKIANNNQGLRIKQQLLGDDRVCGAVNASILSSIRIRGEPGCGWDGDDKTRRSRRRNRLGAILQLEVI